MEYASTPLDITAAPLSDMERRVLGYWQAACGDAVAPPRTRFRLDELPPEAVPWCSVVDVVREPLGFIIRFWGTARRNLYGHEITGFRVSDGDNPISINMFKQISTVVAERRPIYFRAVGRRDGRDPVEYGILRLPLSDNGIDVDKAFSISYHPELMASLHVLHGTLPPYDTGRV